MTSTRLVLGGRGQVRPYLGLDAVAFVRRRGPAQRLSPPRAVCGAGSGRRYSGSRWPIRAGRSLRAAQVDAGSSTSPRSPIASAVVGDVVERPSPARRVRAPEPSPSAVPAVAVVWRVAHGRMGERDALGPQAVPLAEVGQEPLEHGGADHLGELGLHLLVDGLVPTKASGSSVHHQWNSSPPLPQWRRSHWRMVETTWPSSSTWSSRRRGSCQQTSGL